MAKGILRKKGSTNRTGRKVRTGVLRRKSTPRKTRGSRYT